MANASLLKAPTPRSPQSAPQDAPARPFAMLSHPGRVRHSNQDSCDARPALGAYVVCDGMGGAAGGEVASQLAVEAFLASLAKPAATTPCVRLEAAIRCANQTVFRHSQRSRHLRGMGTTLVALLFEEAREPARPTLWIAHVGDSRCYLLRAETLHLLTQDHSLVEEQFRAGLITRVQASASPLRNIITRAIGSQCSVEPEILPFVPQPGDIFLLASDGLTRELPETEIAQLLCSALSAPENNSANHRPSADSTPTQAVLAAACKSLIDAANHHGGHDNITVLLVPCP